LWCLIFSSARIYQISLAHLNHGVSIASYDFLTRSILVTMKRVLGKDYSNAINNAWVVAFSKFFIVMSDQNRQHTGSSSRRSSRANTEANRALTRPCAHSLLSPPLLRFPHHPPQKQIRIKAAAVDRGTPKMMDD
jgi:hypothetical protein